MSDLVMFAQGPIFCIFYCKRYDNNFDSRPFYHLLKLDDILFGPAFQQLTLAPVYAPTYNLDCRDRRGLFCRLVFLVDDELLHF